MRPFLAFGFRWQGGFNPRICKRCDFCVITSVASLWVSIHASVKDATVGIVQKVFCFCFNPRICKRCDQNTCYYCLNNDCFNPRICKRCDCSPQHHIAFKKSFNPRICKRCDITYFKPELSMFVSIHASVKDATFFRR